MHPLLEKLLHSDEPSIRLKTLQNLLGEHPQSPQVTGLQQEVRTSIRVQTLLSDRDSEGRIPCHPYKKWYGAHWVLTALADLGYPPGDSSLNPLREQELDWLLSDKRAESLLTVEGRVRRCASMEGNGLYSLLALGLIDDRLDELANRLMKWQWPDGGWNCDKRPSAHHSSFMETAIPMRALALYARLSGNPRARTAVERAADVFLKRHLYLGMRSGQPIDTAFTLLHYPIYWHYDILWGLKLMTEVGLIGDERCRPALSLLESYRLPDGSFPAHKKLYKPANLKAIVPIDQRLSGYSLVNWGSASGSQMNEFITVDALAVLRQAGRWQP